jgi:hypothetical protein
LSDYQLTYIECSQCSAGARGDEIDR